MQKISSPSSRSSQRGSIHAIVALVLVVSIIGAVGYLFWSKTSAQETISYDPRVDVTSDTDVDEMRGAPASLKSFITGRIETLNSGFGENPEDCFGVVSARKIVGNEYAIGDITIDGGSDGCAAFSSEIWALDDNDAWQIVATTQDDTYACDKLTEYNVPVEIAGIDCFNDEGAPVKYEP